MRIGPSSIAAFLVAIVFTGGAEPGRAAEPNGLPAYLADRGDGIPTSLLGTYIRAKEFIVYPFYEYTRFKNFEYEPSELGFQSKQEFKNGKLVEQEALIFLAYAFNDSLAIEFESAVWSSAKFTKDPTDTTGTPNQIQESGLGDTEINIRWRILKETETRPDITLFLATVFPLQKSKKLIGTQSWELEPGVVLTKGFSFGTLSLRASLAYNSGENKLEFGEWGIDYLKRLSPQWRIALSIEGDQVDEVSFIAEAQYTLGKNAVLKLNCGFGLTKKAPVVAPEIGVLFKF